SSRTPKNGTRWQGLHFNNQAPTSASHLDACVIEYGGAGGQAALRIGQTSITVNDVSVTASAGVGMQITGNATPNIVGAAVSLSNGDGIQVASGSQPTFAGSTTILQNAGTGMLSQGCGSASTSRNCSTSSSAIRAQNVYWGDDSGPLDGSDDRASGGLYNPSGHGDRVSDCICYDPPIHIHPSVEGTLAAVSGGGQSGPPGSLLPTPLVARVTSNLGTPLSGIKVIFSTAAGGAQIETDQPVTTDANGQASAVVRLGAQPGPNTITVTARDVNSPLATFAAQGSGSNATELFALTVLPSSFGVGSGDVNGDGRVDNLDAALIEAALSSRVPSDDETAADFASRGDVNGDGVVDRGDELVILNRVVEAVPLSMDQATTVASRAGAKPGTARARLRRPRVAPKPDETFRVPIEVLTVGGDTASYALTLQYDWQTLELVSIDGGRSAGFADPPIHSRPRTHHGRIRLAGVNQGLQPTRHGLSVATLVFRIVGGSGDRARIALRGTDIAAIVTTGHFKASTLVKPPVLTVPIR
ncbi:MAG: hypothetical protein HY270_00955, partial [Deltaproteobacteria bacterium]|nr:hypothetical protein [Deltaproteobacteria bacterium]